MPISKARTNDWVKLANTAVVARDYLRARYEQVKILSRAIAAENLISPRGGHVWVSKSDLAALLGTYGQVGKLLTRALKERENARSETRGKI